MKPVLTSVLALAAILASTSCYYEGPAGGPGYGPGYGRPGPGYGPGYGSGYGRPGYGGSDRDGRVDSRRDREIFNRGVAAGRADRRSGRGYNVSRHTRGLRPGDRAEFARGYNAGYR